MVSTLGKRTCMGAQLTGEGIAQHLVNGAFLHNSYIIKHKLLSETPHPGELSVRSTDYSRTYQSALAFIHGMFPHMDLSQIPLTITDNINFCDDHLGGVSCFCPVIGRLREFSKKEELKMRSNMTSYLLSSIKKEFADVYGMNVGRVPWIGSIVEVLMGYICHNLPLPCSRGTIIREEQSNHRDSCIQMPLVGKMWQYLDTRGSILLSGHAEQKYNILFMYPLLREIAQHMVNITRNQSVPKVTLYSGHDLTITPLAKALGIHNGHWAPYGSRLIIELYSSTNTQHYVRILYNGKDRTNTLKFCKSYLHNNMCPLQRFVDFAFQEVFRFFKYNTYIDTCNN